MLKHRLYSLSIPLSLSLVIIVSGCQHNTVPLASESTNSSEAAGLISFGSSHYSLSPGASNHIVKTDISKLKKVSFSSSQPEIITVDDKGIVHVSSNASIGSKAIISSNYKGESTECTITVKYSLLDTLTTTANGKKVVTDAEDVAVVVNKQRSLPDNYIPADLVVPEIPFIFKEIIEKRMLRSVAAKALEQLVAQAETENIHLFGVSGYRSYVTQKSVYNGNVQDKGSVEANKISAIPGQSEHQTGLAIDLTNNVPEDQLVESFGDSKEGKWLAAHAADYGFIIRYLNGKESLTGYAYEPWHIRYVGKDIAEEIYADQLTLEQYFDDAIAVQGS
ncbi:D-alanyl-D-alanine carboxypeptidase family protein [Paenibacillus psychroresistens]|uniref:D-alanyl-D-alanine carboxypeptidase family protein n=1 Tax=Paenibacillus psychroresistens TaxID=1778678 RepID=A0A6B8RIE3_9BACL|nr:M15 family metallopeptidase [Paenibacillus psychroresistens]QGQ95332.1 D-alanyl-D-alanine carboxypeptidase family protein [Paenibacillus psychroresistens]